MPTMKLMTLTKNNDIDVGDDCNNIYDCNANAPGTLTSSFRLLRPLAGPSLLPGALLPEEIVRISAAANPPDRRHRWCCWRALRTGKQLPTLHMGSRGRGRAGRRPEVSKDPIFRLLNKLIIELFTRHKHQTVNMINSKILFLKTNTNM